MATTPPSQPTPDSGGIHIGDVGGSVNFSALGDIVGGDKITTITTTIQISVEAVTQRSLITASPYRGLDRFEDRDKDLFFGRDQLIKSLLAQLSASNVLLILGASGSGKSSVVRAGLLPQLAQLIGARFRYFTFVPDVNPFESLRSALQGAGFSQTQTRELADARPETATKLIHTLQRESDQWLFFVDQFEEIFTVGDESLRASFIAALVAIAQDPSSSTKLVLAMRADFLDRFSPFPQFAKIVEKNIDFVADMHPDELRLAIEQPAARHGVVFEQGLVEEIIKDVQGQAGSLPLLQYTLDLLWQDEARGNGLTDRHLNTRAYRELGGVRGALQKRADEIYASFGDGTDAKTATPKQAIVRQIFLRLVDLAGEGSNDAAWRPVRRRASMATFTTAQEREILQALINQKLLVSNREGDDATVEVAHEALFTSWGRLKNWIEAGKQVIFAKNRLADDARRWQRRQKEGDSGADEELLSGSRLAQALDLRARGDFVTVVGGLDDSENLFLDRSAAQREKRARLRRMLEIAGVALLIISIAGAIFGWIGQRNAAKGQRDAAKKAAEAQLALSQSDFLRAAELLRDQDPRKAQTALALLARACRTDPTNGLAATRLFSLLSQRNWILPLIEPVPHPEPIERTFFHPSDGGATFVTSTNMVSRAIRKPVRIWDAKSGALLYGPENSHLVCNERWLSPKEPWILLPLGREVRIANFVTKEIRQPTLKCSSEVTLAQFNQDSATILICGQDGEVTTWNAQSGLPVGRPIKFGGIVTAFSRDGSRAFASDGHDERTWKLDFAAGKAVAVGNPIRGDFKAMSADGRKVCIANQEINKNPEIYFADADSSGEPLSVKLTNKPASDRSYVELVTLTSDGRRAVSVELRQSLSGLKATDSSVREESGAADQPEKEEQWDFVTGQLRLWDLATGKQIARMWHETHQFTEGVVDYVDKTASFSPEGFRIASTYLDARSLRLWDGRDGAALNELPCANSDLSSLFLEGAFNPGGTQLITMVRSGDVQVWDVQPTVPFDRPVRVNGKFTKARFSQDGKEVRLVAAVGEPRDFLVEDGQPASAPAEFTKPDLDAADVPDPTARRRFDQTETSAEKRSLVEVGDNKGLRTSVILNPGHHFKFSRDGTKVFILKEDVVEVILLSAESGLPAHDTFASCYNAWFSPDGSKVIIAGYHAQGLRVVDVASGADLMEPLPFTGLQAKAAAFTLDGIVVTYLGESYAEIRRVDFWLKSAPPLLADVAEAIAQHRLNDFGVLEAKCVTIPKLREIGASAGKSSSPPLFANWLKWFLTPGENRPVAPGSGLTLAQFVEKYGEISSDNSLRQAEFLALGNQELLAKLAAARAKIAARREELRKAGNTNEEN